MDLAQFVVQLFILVVLFGLLSAVKSGFNEVIRGLESISKQGHES